MRRGRAPGTLVRAGGTHRDADLVEKPKTNPNKHGVSAARGAAPFHAGQWRPSSVHRIGLRSDCFPECRAFCVPSVCGLRAIACHVVAGLVPEGNDAIRLGLKGLLLLALRPLLALGITSLGAIRVVVVFIVVMTLIVALVAFVRIRVLPKSTPIAAGIIVATACGARSHHARME